jgi:hypothetical protein
MMKFVHNWIEYIKYRYVQYKMRKIPIEWKFVSKHKYKAGKIIRIQKFIPKN